MVMRGSLKESMNNWSPVRLNAPARFSCHIFVFSVPMEQKMRHLCRFSSFPDRHEVIPALPPESGRLPNSTGADGSA